MIPFPPLAADALARHTPQQPARLTRALFAQTITWLALAPRTPSPERDRLESVLALPVGPDWHPQGLRDFLASYAWHILFSHSPNARALMPASMRAVLGHPRVPVFWEAQLADLAPSDLAWMLDWNAQFIQSSLLGTLLDRHMGNPDWAGVWTAWAQAAPQTHLVVPASLITHPALTEARAPALGALRTLLPLADTHPLISSGPHALDSAILGHMLGWAPRQSGGPLAPRRDQTFSLSVHDNADQRLFEDTMSPTGLAALRQAFPTPESFIDAGPTRRAAHHAQRLFGAAMPVTKAIKAPSTPPEITAMIDQGRLCITILPKLTSFQRRAHEALAAGGMDPRAADRLRDKLAQIATCAGHARLTMPEAWVANPKAITREDRRRLSDAITAAYALAGAGHTALFTQARSLHQSHLVQHHSWSIETQAAIAALLAHPSVAGLRWVCDTINPQTWMKHIPVLMQTPSPDADWMACVHALPQSTPHRWFGATDNHQPSFLNQGGPWLFANPAHRQAWWQAEVAKPKARWDMDAHTLRHEAARLANPFAAPVLGHWDLLGVLRLSLALRAHDTDWLDAFTAAAQSLDKPGAFSLLWRWKQASAHQRIALTALLGDPEALLDREGADVAAAIAAIFA